MEYGLIPKIDQYSDNKALELQKVQRSSDSSKVLGQTEQLQKIQKEMIQNDKKVSEAKKIESQTTNPKFEYTLTNTNFGFNDSSKDFYVKAIRGNAQNQYPTEDMMRLKAYMMSLEQTTASAS